MKNVLFYLVFVGGISKIGWTGDHTPSYPKPGTEAHRSLLDPSPQRTITDIEEAKSILASSENNDSEWLPVSCSQEGCTFQKQQNGKIVEEVFIPSSVKNKILPKSIGETQHHESKYPELNNHHEYQRELEKNKKIGNRYMMVKFGAPNHNCLSCLRFDKFMENPKIKEMLTERKVTVYTTDVGEFNNPQHAELAKNLGAQVANGSFHIPYVAIVDLRKDPPVVKTLLNGYFGGTSTEREQQREMKKIQRFIE